MLGHNVDVYTCTHNHLDHTDPVTIAGIRNRDTTHFVGPHPSCQVYSEQRIESARIVPAWPDCELEFRDVAVYGTFALPTDETDLNHIGFVFRFGSNGRKSVFRATQTIRICWVRQPVNKPDVMITCINGGFNNLSHFEAAKVAAKVKPRIAVPCHYDMFSDNSADPRMFRASLQLCAPDVAYTQLRHAAVWTFSIA